jgi:subtilisin-like proprotein convertase family protein
MSAVISEARALQLGHLDAMLRGFDHRFGHLGAHDAAREPGRWSLGIDDRAHA